MVILLPPKCLLCVIMVKEGTTNSIKKSFAPDNLTILLSLQVDANNT